MEEKHNVVLLPTKEASRLFIQDGYLYDGIVASFKHDAYADNQSNQHLYVTSPTEIGEGDYVKFWNDICQALPLVEGDELKRRNVKRLSDGAITIVHDSYLKKIVATINPKLNTMGIDTISADVLQDYVSTYNTLNH